MMPVGSPKIVFTTAPKFMFRPERARSRERSAYVRSIRRLRRSRAHGVSFKEWMRSQQHDADVRQWFENKRRTG